MDTIKAAELLLDVPQDIYGIDIGPSPTPYERAERLASRIGGALLFLLATYVTGAAGWQLWRGIGEEFSWLGLHRRVSRYSCYALPSASQDHHR